MAEELQIAKAYVQIIPSALGIQGAISQQLGGEAEAAGKSAGNTIAGTIKKVLAAAGIGAAVKKIFSDAFAQGSELEQNLGGTEAVFGEYANTIQQYATNAYKQMGLSASDYMATANKMASLFQGSGLSQQRSLDLTTQAMQRAADVASVMGIDASWAMESIAGAAKGNFEMMDNLGVAMNATTLQAYALEKGINFNWNTASQAEKSELAMRMFMERTTQYAGNFAKEAQTTWAGSMDAMKGAYENLMGNIALGKDIGPSLQALSSTVSTFLTGSFIPTVLNIITALPPAIVTLVGNIGADLVAAIQAGATSVLPRLPQLASQVVTGFNQGIQEGLPKFLEKGVEAINSLVNGILSNLPVVLLSAGTLISGFLSGIFDALPMILSAGVDILINLVNGIVNNLPQIVAAAVNLIAGFVETIYTNFPQIIQTGIELIGKLAAGLIRAIPDLVSKIPEIIGAVTKRFSETDWGEIGVNIIKGIATGLKSALGMIGDALKDVAKWALNAIKEALGIHSPSTVFRDEVGKMMALGLGEGFEKNIPVKAISGGVDKALDEARKIMNLPEVVEGSSAAVEMRKNLVYQQETERRQTQNPKGMFGNFSGREAERRLTIEVPVYLQDREIARAITPYIGEQMSWEMM